jgi:hypothetical protein
VTSQNGVKVKWRWSFSTCGLAVLNLLRAKVESQLPQVVTDFVNKLRSLWRAQLAYVVAINVYKSNCMERKYVVGHNHGISIHAYAIEQQ